jgi:hypothetical protein
MELLNVTGMPAGYTLGVQPDGRELLVVAIKGTFAIPQNGEEPALAAEQVPLFEADVFSGEPGFSAPVYESDYAPCKPRCDVLLHGSAYAPGGKPTQRVRVSLQVGSMSKSFDVVGNRVWEKRLFIIKASKPEPLTVMPISYNNAFGGVDNTHKQEKKHRAYLTNPVGLGFHSNRQSKYVHDKPLPNTEEPDEPIKKPHRQYNPMSFGPIGRSWPPRLKYAGTYDDNWLENVFPFLPDDFDNAYYQSAPTDQQINYLQGGEEVLLSNLTPHGYTQFHIPQMIIPVVFFLKSGVTHKTQGVADTLILEPDDGRFMVTWRASLPLKKNMFEVVQILTGEVSRGWWRARELSKVYYRSLEELIREKRQKIEEGIEWAGRP